MAVGALIVGIIALVVGLVSLTTVLQMFCGRPKISLEVGEDNLEGGIVLECKVWNEPFENKLLKIIGIKRMPIEDLTAILEISEAGSGRILYPPYAPKIRAFSGTYAQRISLPSSPIHASFGVVYMKSKNEPVKLFKEDSTLTFIVGKYVASIGVIADYKGYKYKATFVVSDNEPYLCWLTLDKH